MIDNSNKGNSNPNIKDAVQNPNLANKPSNKNNKKYQKLVYRVADVTSEEEGYPASELLNHTPYSRGWQSARYAEFPQEIILEFGQTVRVKQIQFLSHQYKISKKIELMIYNPNSSKKFKKIGYLSLDSNERSNYQARELKSVYIDHDCQKIKVILHSAWENNHNLFRQVGLISINVQGEYENKVNDLINMNNNNLMEEKKNEEKNTFEDNIKYDPYTLAKLKSLNAMKDEAIASEDYDKAQMVKNAINRLKSVANQLLVLEERKQIAIKNEQFDQAKLFKLEIDSLRDEAAKFDINQMSKNNNNNTNNNNEMKKPSGNVSAGFNKLKKNSNTNNKDLIDANYGGNDEYNENIMDEYNNNQRQQTGINSRTPMGKDIRSNQNTKTKFDNVNNNFEPEENNDNFYNNNNNSKSNFNNQPDKKQSDSRNNLNTPNNQNNLTNDDYDNNNLSNKSKKPNFKNNSGKINDNEKSPVDVDKIVIKGNNQNFDDLLNEKMKEEKLNKQKNSNNKQQSNLDNPNTDDNAQESDDIPEKEYPIAEPFIAIFSYDLVKLLFSKAWKKKEEGLKQIEKEIGKYPKSSVINSSSFGPDNVLISAFGVAEYILNSTLAQPALAAMDLLKTVLAKFSKENLNKLGNSKQDLLSKAEKIVGLLLEKTADANPKLKEKAEITVNEFADSPLIGPKIVLNYLLTGKVKKTLVNSAKHLMSRLNLLNRNIEFFGLDGIEDLDAFVQFAVNGFKNPNKDVRDSAFNLIMNIYKFIGDDIKKHFKDLRPAQVSALEEGFDGVEVVGMNSNVNKQINKNLLNDNKAGNLGNKPKNQGSSGSLEMPKSENTGNKSAKARNDNRRKSAGKNRMNQEEEYEDNQNNNFNENQNFENNNNNLQCDFCGYSDENLDEDTLALHLYKQCPWLTSCFKCKQTVEISSLNSHFINECQAKKDFRVCSRCKEPILANQYEKHTSEKSCIPAKNQNVANRCPLCHTDMTPAGKNGWTLHLLEEGCPNNPRGRY